MLEVSNISKSYGNKVALQDISFCVQQGEVVGFLGTNGAGKSTTMNIITGYLSASSGTVTVDGFDVLSSPLKAKARIGYLPEIPPLYQDMTVWESLLFTYDLKKSRMDRKKHLEEICELVKIDDVKERLVRNLSKGYRQRVGIACALVGDPPILIFDEPTVGLDPKQIIEIRSLIQTLAKTRTVILSSHILQEVQAVCGRVMIINNGVIVADDTPEHLTEQASQNLHLALQVKGEREAVRSTLEGIAGVRRVDLASAGELLWKCSLDTAGEDLREAIFFALAEKRLPILELHDQRATLEDVFLRLTREAAVVPEQIEAQDDTASVDTQDEDALSTPQESTPEGEKSDDSNL